MATTMPEPRTGKATFTREVGDIELGIAPNRLPPPPAARQPKASSSLASWLVAVCAYAVSTPCLLLAYLVSVVYDLPAK